MTLVSLKFFLSSLFPSFDVSFPKSQIFWAYLRDYSNLGSQLEAIYSSKICFSSFISRNFIFKTFEDFLIKTNKAPEKRARESVLTPAALTSAKTTNGFFKDSGLKPSEDYGKVRSNRKSRYLVHFNESFVNFYIVRGRLPHPIS